MEIFEKDCFLHGASEDLHYVGVMKSPEGWFPFCVLSNPRVSDKLDTLPLCRSHQGLLEMLNEYARQIPQIEKTFVQSMTREEIRDLMCNYGLTHVALIPPLAEGSGCVCGCGCA